ncbi:MAG TPA: hypothetical protein VFL83_15740 [Anaeromyxobacter sp.]|nr:hypothetical protein [Anaeromyxobacter sp.]
MTSDPSAAEIHGRDFPADAAAFEDGERARGPAERPAPKRRLDPEEPRRT